MPTPSMEDYLERIYKLIDEKGYARVSDIAEGLEVHPSSVTKMIQKLDKDEYLIYEKYRGLVLTSKGKKMGKRLMERHHLLEEFLEMIGVQDENIYKDVEGIEHHLSWDSIMRIETLVEYFKRDENRLQGGGNMTNEERDIQELKRQIHALEKRIETLKSKSRSSAQNFWMAFFIVVMIVLFSIGVIRYFRW